MVKNAGPAGGSSDALLDVADFFDGTRGEKQTQSVAVSIVSESLIATLAAEIRQLRHDINLLIDKTPQTASPWIPPRELARLLGIKSQTIAAYRSEGRFRSSSIRAIKRGQRTDWEYHRQDAIDDVMGVA